MDSTLTVQFNFPYAAVTLEKVPDEVYGVWADHIRNDRTFEARISDTDVKFGDRSKVYLINPSLLTYVQVTKASTYPF